MTEPASITSDAEVHQLTGSSPPTGEAPKIETVATADADLLALIERHVQVVRDWVACGDMADCLSEQFERSKPAMPKALFWRGLGDPGHIPTSYDEVVNGTSRPCYDGDTVADLKSKPNPQKYIHIAGIHSPDSNGFAWVPDEDKIARKAEIIAAWEAWKAEQQCLMDSIGLTETDARNQELIDVMDDISKSIEKLRPTTLTGLVAKARWATETAGLDKSIARSVLLDVCGFGDQQVLTSKSTLTHDELAALKFEPADVGDWKAPTAEEWAALKNPILITLHVAEKIIKLEKADLVQFVSDIDSRGEDCFEAVGRQLQSTVDFFDSYHSMVDAATIRYMSAAATIFEDEDFPDGQEDDDAASAA